MNIADWLQIFLTTLSQGSIYVLLALAYNMTFSTARVLNFSLGSFLMLGAVLGLEFWAHKDSGARTGIPFIAILVLMVVIGSALGWATKKLTLPDRWVGKSLLSSVLITLALAGILRNLVERWWSNNDHRFPSPIGDEVLRWSGAGIYPQELLVVLMTIFIVVAFEIWKSRSDLGHRLIAVSQDPEMLELLGIPSKQIINFSFILSTVLVMLAGVLVAPITTVSATMGVVIGIKAYAVAIVGGNQSAYGSWAAGMLLALLEVLTARMISTGYKDLPGFIILVVIILLRPNGLFSRAGARRV